VYDLRGEAIVGQYYAEELMSVKITRGTDYQIQKIPDTRDRRGIRAHSFRKDDRPLF
jgi:hypothetical protein